MCNFCRFLNNAHTVTFVVYANKVMSAVADLLQLNLQNCLLNLMINNSYKTAPVLQALSVIMYIPTVYSVYGLFRPMATGELIFSFFCEDFTQPLPDIIQPSVCC